jgi:hypothetical protein
MPIGLFNYFSIRIFPLKSVTNLIPFRAYSLFNGDRKYLYFAGVPVGRQVWKFELKLLF